MTEELEGVLAWTFRTDGSRSEAIAVDEKQRRLAIFAVRVSLIGIIVSAVIGLLSWMHPFEPKRSSPLQDTRRNPASVPTTEGGVALELDFQGNSEEVSPGDTIAYSLEIGNVGKQTVDPIYIAMSLPPRLLYVSGSTFAYGEGEPVKNIADRWMSDGANLGQLSPGGVIRLAFQARVQEDAEAGSFIETVVQLKKTWSVGDSNEWVQFATHVTVESP